MWQLNFDEQGPFVTKQGANWARVVGAILTIIGGLGTLSNFAGGVPALGLVWALVVLMPGIVLLTTLAKAKTRRVAAVLGSVPVAGGTVVTLLDDAQERHEVLADQPTVDRVVEQFAPPAL